MEEHHKVDLHLTSKQKNKYMKGEPFQMTADQCSSGSKKNHHHLCAVLSKKEYNHLLKNTHNKKGTRFSENKFMEGTGFFKDVFKGIAKGVAPVLIDKVGDVTGTRSLTDSLLKPNSDKIIDLVGSGIQIDQMKNAVMPRDKFLRSNEMRLAVMPNQEVGSGLKKKGRFVKGSIEAKEFMLSIRKRKGGNIFDDIGKKLKETFNPDLGRKIKDALTSDTAKKVYKGISDVAIPIIATSTGNPLLGQVAKIGVDAALGNGLKKKTIKRGLTIKTTNSTLIGGVPQVIKCRLQGGSFKGL